MIIRVYGKNYKAKQNLAFPAKKLVLQFLDEVKKQSSVKGMGEFYTSVVVMMYVVSSSILKELSVDNLSVLYKNMELEAGDAEKKSSR